MNIAKNSIKVFILLTVFISLTTHARRWRKAKITCSMDYTTAPNIDEGIFESQTEMINEFIWGHFLTD